MRCLLSLVAVFCGVICIVATPAPAQNDTATALNAKVIELSRARKYAEAIPLAQRALAIRERTLGPNHLDVAVSLNNLAPIPG